MFSIPLVNNDPPKSGKAGRNDSSDPVVNLFNGCKTANVKAGSLVPLSNATVASDCDLRKEERLVKCVHAQQGIDNIKEITKSLQSRA